MLAMVVAFVVVVLAVAVAALVTFVMSRLPTSPAPDMSHFRGKLLGHRGCRNQYDIPENSLLAFRFAHEHGADGVEVDVYLSKDDEIVVHHDPIVDATTFAMGRVADFTYAQFNALRFRPKAQRRRAASESSGEEQEQVVKADADENDPSAPTSEAIADAALRRRTSATAAETENAAAAKTKTATTTTTSLVWTPRIPLPTTLRQGEDPDGPPSLLQVILFCEAHGLYLMIEFKESQRPLLLFQKLVELYEQHPWLYERSYVASFLLLELVQLRRLAPRIPVCFLFCRQIVEWTYKEKQAGRLPLPLPWWVSFAPTRYAVDWLLENFPYTPLLSLCGFRMIGPELALATDDLFRRMDAAGVVVDVWVVNTRRDRERIEKLSGVVTTDKTFNQPVWVDY